MSRPVFLERASRIIFHAVIVGSVYTLFAGHNQPGGGFVGAPTAPKAPTSASTTSNDAVGARCPTTLSNGMLENEQSNRQRESTA